MVISNSNKAAFFEVQLNYRLFLKLIKIKGKDGRYLVRQNLENNVDILEVAPRSDIIPFRTAMKKLYGVNIKYNKSSTKY